MLQFAIYPSRIYLFICFCFLLPLTGFGFTQSEKDSLASVISHIETDTVKIKFLLRLSSQLKQEHPKVSIEYGKQALQYAVKINFYSGITQACFKIGDTYFANEQYDSATVYYYKIISLAEVTKDSASISRSYYSFGKVYWRQARGTRDTSFLIKAMVNYKKALDIRSNCKDTAGLGICLNAMGVVFDEYGNVVKSKSMFDSAIYYYQRALPFREVAADSSGWANTLMNLGSVNGDLGLLAAHGDSKLLFNKKYFFEQELLYHRMALNMFKAIGYTEKLAGIYENLGKTYIKLGDPASSLSEIDTGIQVALSSSPVLYISLCDLYEAKAMAYDSMGNYREAYACLAIRNLYSDTAIGISSAKQVIESEEEFETQASKQEAEHQAKEANRQKMLKTGFQVLSIFLALALAILLFAIYVYRKFYGVPSFENNKDGFLLIAQSLIFAIYQVLYYAFAVNLDMYYRFIVTITPLVFAILAVRSLRWKNKK
jgi:tetratricopeptide (TPR) repeat protein